MAIALLPAEKDIGRIVRAVIELITGRANNVVDVTLTPNAGSTTVNFVNCSVACGPIPIPLNAHAAAEIGNGTLYISSITNGAFTITHANNAQTDRNFRFICAGG